MIGAFEKMASLSGLTKPDCAEFLAHVQQLAPSELGTMLGYLLGRRDGRDAAAWVGALRDMHPQQDLRLGGGKLTINVVGTGGGPPTFNITTTASFVVAAAGLVVIKTGSGAWRSKAGFADLAGQLRTLKIPMSWKAIEDIAREIGIVHVPPYHHAPVLTELALKLGLPTFRQVGTYVNLTGPLLSPVKVARRFFGVGSRGWIEVLAEACQLLGDTPTTLCYSDDGLDEVSPTTNSTLIQLAGGNQRTSETIDPRSLGIEAPSWEELQGFEPVQAAICCERILGGRASKARTQVVALNAAAVMISAGVSPDLETAYRRAMDLIAQGEALRKLQDLRRCVANA